MALDAISANSKTLVHRIEAKEQGKPDVIQNEELQPETKKPVETLIFAKTTQFAKEAPKIAAISKPIAEHTQAAAGSTKYTPELFTFNNDGRLVIASHSPSGSVTALASALTGAESNKGSGQKQQGEQNTFLSAHKDLKDTRFEALGNDDFMSIMKGLC